MIRPARFADATLLATLHAATFPDDPWPALGFMTLLASPGTDGFVLEDEHGPAGFAFLRSAAGESEVITIGVHPDERGRGHGRALVQRIVERAAERGSGEIYLEVAEDNPVAIRLYTELRFIPVGRRPGYYRRSDGQITALVLRRSVD